MRPRLRLALLGRHHDGAVEFVREHSAEGKPFGVICHGPWTLGEAGVVDGRTLTSHPSLETGVRNAGGGWVGEEVVTDDGLVTSRDPDDLDAFCDAIVEEFVETPQSGRVSPPTARNGEVSNPRTTGTQFRYPR